MKNNILNRLITKEKEIRIIVLHLGEIGFRNICSKYNKSVAIKVTSVSHNNSYIQSWSLLIQTRPQGNTYHSTGPYIVSVLHTSPSSYSLPIIGHSNHLARLGSLIYSSHRPLIQAQCRKITKEKEIRIIVLHPGGNWVSWHLLDFQNTKNERQIYKNTIKIMPQM